MCYENGYAVEENTHKAAEYYKLAADKGNQEAKYRLDILYHQGLPGNHIGIVNSLHEFLLSADFFQN